MDSKRRTLLTTGAAAAAVAAAPGAFAQATGKTQTAGRFYEKGNVRIHYEDVGSGVPLLIIPGGGQNSTIGWAVKSAPFNPTEQLRNEIAASRPTCATRRAASLRVRSRSTVRGTRTPTTTSR
jgi:hypothetical protein